jgi:hypothetical protein
MIMVVTPAKGGDPRGTTQFEESADRKNVSGADGRFEVTGVAPGPGELQGLAVDFIDSPYGMVQQRVELAATPAVVELGDVEVARSRGERQ